MTKNPKNGCDPTLIDRFFDGELGPEEHEGVRRHIADCPSCQRALRENREISTLFRDGLNRELSRTDTGELEERVVALVRKKGAPWWKKVIEMFPQKRLFIPATAVAAVALFLTLTRQPAPTPDPSAIVKSFSGDISSVMIIEAPQSRQTIIWYSESP